MANEREAVPFEEQLRGMEAVVKAGKVRRAPGWVDLTVLDQYTKTTSTWAFINQLSGPGCQQV